MPIQIRAHAYGTPVSVINQKHLPAHQANGLPVKKLR